MSLASSNQEASHLACRLADAAVAKGDFASDASKDRELYDSIDQAATKLLALGAPGRNELRQLLSHESERVRLWAASYLMPQGSIEAENVLLELSRKDGILGLNAATTLRELRMKRQTLHTQAHDA
jgi:hypothetical protein